MSGKAAKRMRKLQQLEMRQLVKHTLDLKAYTNGLPLRRRVAIAIAILVGRW